MEISIVSRLKHAWNAFSNRDPTNDYRPTNFFDYSNYSHRPDRIHLTRGNERSIITSIFNRIALDVSTISIKHCKLDDNERFIEVINSGLNNCLNLEANRDQTGRLFIQDVVMSMFDEGCVAMVPVDTSSNPKDSNAYDILSMRTGKILEWYPEHVKVQVYNEQTGKRQEVKLPKRMVSIIENPLYAVVNEPNSTLQRLKRKLALLDVTDEKLASNKLDMIIQLPYSTRSDVKKQQAEKRRNDLQDQLVNSPYGIAYMDSTEKIIQLNRPIENNLLKQVEYLTNTLYSQLGITQAVLDGTADEKTMLNYHSRCIEPIVSAIVDEMKRKFLTKTARTQKQSITFFRDPFKLVPITSIAEIADTLTRNEILTSNEIRQIIGMKPSDDPRADELRNSNMPQQDGANVTDSEAESNDSGQYYDEGGGNQNEEY